MQHLAAGQRSRVVAVQVAIRTGGILQARGCRDAVVAGSIAKERILVQYPNMVAGFVKLDCESSASGSRIVAAYVTPFDDEGAVGSRAVDARVNGAASRWVEIIPQGSNQSVRR